MRTDNRLSQVLHVLLHLARADRPLTSEQIAGMLTTNPAVVRRTLAGLRRAGLVESAKGHGGGWRMICDLRSTSLHDLYLALGEPTILSLGFADPASPCLVAQASNKVIQTALSAAEADLRERFKRIMLADVAAEFERRVSDRLGEIEACRNVA